MGSTNSSTARSSDLVSTAASDSEDIFKVDNINSHGRKHASAKIQLSHADLCIRQKHRESLHIPLETIKRYGLDGSIFILECGRRAPLGQARYAFRCKQAPRLVDCLDQRITTLSKQLSDQAPQAVVLSPSSTFTNVSSASHHDHHHSRLTALQRRRAHSDQGLLCQTSSSILVSTSPSSSSALSLDSAAKLTSRNSELNLSGFDLPVDAHSNSPNNHHTGEPEGAFIARLKQSIQRERTPELNYVEFKATGPGLSFEPTSNSLDLALHVDPSLESDTFTATKMLQVCNHEQRPVSLATTITHSEVAHMTPSYAYIDHEKTITLKEITEERLQQQHVRRVET